MRIVHFIDDSGHTFWGKDRMDGTADVIQGDLFQDWAVSGEVRNVKKRLAPVSPPNIYGIGLNYREHARQMGAEIPENPVMFMKPTTCVTHPGDPILIPKCCTQGPEVDYECELAVVIGRITRDVSVDDALSHVFGYTAANEISARRLAKLSRTRGKCMDGFCPLGPALVTADEIPNPQSLELRTTLNGNVMQNGNTSDMIFSVAELVSYVSQDTTLLPGTVILTGTPPGAGFSRTPPVFLEVGDVVEIEAENIGVLSNPVSSESRSVTRAA